MSAQEITLQQRLMQNANKIPQLPDSCSVHDSAVLLGNISIGKNSSIWPMAVLRADINSIRVGRRCNIQDGAILHLSNDHEVLVGDDCSIGHGAILHACTLGKAVLVGMRATILDGAQIGDESIIGAHSLVTKDSVIPPRSLVMGTPAKVVRSLSPEEVKANYQLAQKYVDIAKFWRHEE